MNLIKRNLSLALTLLIVLFLISGASAQSLYESIAGHYSWRNIGPANMGGRVIDIEGVESNPKIMYAAAATGGLWKTVNTGITWEPVFDNEHVSNIGDIGLSSSNPDIIYLGTGEANGRNSSSYGAGIYKSIDAGETWEFIGLEETYHIARIIVHPSDPDIAYAAAMGKLWADNEDRGLYKTADGGRTWNKVLYIDEKTGITDIAMDPVNPSILYAASYERIRDAFSGGDPIKRWGPGSGIWVSTNAGGNWEKISSGLPMTDMGRIGLSASKSQPGTVYALIETSVSPKQITDKMKESIRLRREEQNRQTEEEHGGMAFGGIFRSTDHGKTWTRMSTYNSRPFYYSQIRVDPNDPEVLWMGGMPLGYSDDGGKNVTNDKGGKTHVDYHAVWIDPTDSDHVVLGCDGGIN
ncbi:WD40/YVTN/BNR-like repeat-containing protein, partial [candidate division KSB1 bacterium]